MFFWMVLKLSPSQLNNKNEKLFEPFGDCDKHAFCIRALDCFSVANSDFYDKHELFNLYYKFSIFIVLQSFISMKLNQVKFSTQRLKRVQFNHSRFLEPLFRLFSPWFC